MRQTINGADLRRMIISAAASIEIHKQALNELNVFPVPDGDTGTNMSMTINSAAADLRKSEDPDLYAASKVAASAMLRDLSNILQGARHMLPPACRAGQADNGGCTHSYYVRLPQAAAQEIVLESMECDQGVCRGVTRPLSVRQMHETAARLRAAGHAVFFAAMG